MAKQPANEEADDRPELSIDPDTVCFLIVKAREFDVKVEPDDPDSGSNPSDDREIDVLEDRGDDPTQAEIVGTLAALSEDAIVDLVALTFIGRGDFTADEWEDARDEARQDPAQLKPQYLLGIPLLGDYLEGGFTELGYSCEETDEEHL
ncbi:MAG TPA: DUF3775 domain-containing protein [Dongiaceae bacterium]|jgi:hypothetical protein